MWYAVKSSDYVFFFFFAESGIVTKPPRRSGPIGASSASLGGVTVSEVGDEWNKKRGALKFVLGEARRFFFFRGQGVVLWCSVVVRDSFLLALVCVTLFFSVVCTSVYMQ